MLLKGITALLARKKEEPFLAIDIGSSSIKILSFDLSESRPKLVGAGMAPTPAGAVANNTVVRPDQVAATIRSIIAANEIVGTKATFSVPGPTAFTKRINVAKGTIKELTENIGFEASNYIPYGIEAVHLDFQVMKPVTKTSLEVLLVAVKNDIVRGFTDAIAQAGLEPAIADVDYFALENMFELNYPEEKNRTVALVNIGARFTSVCILSGGEILFSGDVGVGGRIYTDTLCESLGMQPAQAEEAKKGGVVEGFDEGLVQETRDRATEHVAGELHRQIGFFWNAAATDKPIETIYMCGGSAQTPGLLDELSTKTGLPCQLMKTFKGVTWSNNFDQEFIGEVGLSMGVGVGLALRRFGDKKHAMD